MTCPPFFRGTIKVAAFLWIITIWPFWLLMPSRGYYSALTCATALLPTYLLARLVSSHGMAVWAGSAAGILMLQGLRIVPGRNDLALIYLLVPPIAGLTAAIVDSFTRPKPPRPGRCRSCDYDLTGNVSGVCPECGMQINAP
jgi:hypothetical protein